LHWSELAGVAKDSAVTAADVEAAANGQKPNECCAYIYTRYRGRGSRREEGGRLCMFDVEAYT